jgi:hypothetical protein
MKMIKETPDWKLESTTDMMMELAERLGELPDDVDPRAWSHLLVYAPQRTWVGLTKEDKDLVEDLCEMMIGDAAFSTIEAILKGNNGFAEEKKT